MLDELKNLDYPGCKDELLYFVQSIIGKRDMKAEDIRVLCAHAPAGYQLRADALINYSTCFGWLNCAETISVCEEISAILEDDILLNQYMVMIPLCCVFSA